MFPSSPGRHAPSKLLPTLLPARRFIEITDNYKDRKKQLLNLSRQTSGTNLDDTIDSQAFLSYRDASKTLREAMTARGPRSPEHKHAEAFEGSVAERAENLCEGELDDLLTTMMQQYVEVECLLRVKFVDEAAVADARARVHKSLDFDLALNKVTKDAGVLKGTIFQALLTHLGGGNATSAASIGVTIDDAEWQGLVAGADLLRKLIRIKVQDDNDLKAANGSLKSCDEFFANLAVFSKRKGKPEIEIIQKQLAF